MESFKENNKFLLPTIRKLTNVLLIVIFLLAIIAMESEILARED